MKKTMLLALAASMLLSCFAGCSGAQQSAPASSAPAASGAAASSAAPSQADPAPGGKKTKFSATFLQQEWHGDPNNMEIMQRLADEANVEIDWQVYPSATWPDKKNLLLAGGDLPDVFYMNAVNTTDIAKYAPQGMFLDLTELVAQYCPRLSKIFEERPSYKNVCINPDDGKMYTIARGVERSVQYTQALMYINKSWLDQLGLAVPTTTDEFYSALKAFKENDMNGNGSADDEIPFSFHLSYNAPKLDFSPLSLFGAFGYVDVEGSTTPHFVKDEKGELVYVAMQPQYRDAIAFYSKFVQEGLWDAEGFTTQDTSVLSAKGNNAEPILGSFMAFDKSFIIPEDRFDDYVIVEPLAGPDGTRNWLYHGASNGNVNGTQFVMSVAAKGKEEGIMRWLDAHFDGKTSMELFLGPIGITLTETDSGMVDYIPTPSGMSYSEFRYGNAPVHVPCAIQGSDWGKSIQVMEEDRNKLEIAEEHYLPYSKQSSLFLIPNQEESKWLLSRAKDIDQYVSKMQVKWLTEGGIEAEWEPYLSELEKLGIGEYYDMVKVMMDRMAS